MEESALANLKPFQHIEPSVLSQEALPWHCNWIPFSVCAAVQPADLCILTQSLLSSRTKKLDVRWLPGVYMVVLHVDGYMFCCADICTAHCRYMFVLYALQIFMLYVI